jgi:small subunit ribosomal protein S5
MARIQPKGMPSEERDDGLKEKMIAVNRVTKVVKGGRILGFAAVVPDGDGCIGWVRRRASRGCRSDEKALRVAHSGEERTVHHLVEASTARSSCRRRRGTGVIAGGPMRAVFDVMGVRNIVAKSHGSTNPYNLVRATLNALEQLRTPAEIAAKRGKSVEELFG